MVSYEVVQEDIITGFAPCRLSPKPSAQTLAEAVKRLTSPIDYVVAVENGKTRELTPEEEAEYRNLLTSPERFGSQDQLSVERH